MFSALKNNSPIYILDISDDLQIKTGHVQTASVPQPVFGQPFGSPNSTIDIVANVEGDTAKFKGIPANLSAANLGNVIICDTREAMDAELENLQRESEQVVNSTEYHRKRAKRCTEIRKELNPQFEKEQKQEERITKIEDAINNLSSMIAAALNNKKQNDNDHHPADRNR